MLGGLRARVDEEPILVVPAFQDVEHAQRELAEAGAVFGVSVLDILEGGHDEDRLLVHASAQAAQHLARLGGVGGPGYEGERHIVMVASRPDRLARARPGERPRQVPR